MFLPLAQKTASRFMNAATEIRPAVHTLSFGFCKTDEPNLQRMHVPLFGADLIVRLQPMILAR
jgi:hypothetical protein